MITTRHRNQIISFALMVSLLWAYASLPVHAQSFEDLTYLTEEYYPFNYADQEAMDNIKTTPTFQQLLDKYLD